MENYIAQGCIPGGTKRNWDSYGHDIALSAPEQQWICADPQTSGGLLLAIEESQVEVFKQFCTDNQLLVYALGEIIPQAAKSIYVV